LAHVADLAWRATQTRQGWSALYDSLEQAVQDQSDKASLLQALALLAQESRRLHGPRTLSRHLQALLQGMQALGMSDQLEQDAAGTEILQRLKTTLQALPESDEVVLTLHEFQAWLSQQLETHAFCPVSTAAPCATLTITMVSLRGARLRPWDAVVWVGAGAELMQPALQETLFFGTRVRHELGLPTRAQAQAQMERHLLELLNLNVPTTLTWRARQGDEPLALAPLLARLQLLALRQQRPAFVRPYAAQLQTCAVQALEAQASVAVHSALLPARLSARHWEALVACPYRFWAQAAWRLDERDEIQDTASKRDYGNAVHQILYRAHTLFEQQPEQDFAALLDAVAAEIFTTLAQNYPDAFAWEQRFEAWKTHYVSWWQQQREQGWRWQGGELRREYVLPLRSGRSLTLYGRLDRLDRHEQDQRFRILDYKAKSHEQLKRMQRDLGEQVQLLFYGLLCQSEAEQQNFSLNAGYLSAEESGRELTSFDALPDDSLFVQILQAEKQRIEAVWLGLSAGTRLLAQGTTEVCRHCAMRGLCRRDERKTPLSAAGVAA
jgi:ATP-dependent helicase/nuclease subunit B